MKSHQRNGLHETYQIGLYSHRRSVDRILHSLKSMALYDVLVAWIGNVLASPSFAGPVLQQSSALVERRLCWYWKSHIQ